MAPDARRHKGFFEEIGISQNDANVWLCFVRIIQHIPDSKVHGANMGPTWVLSALGGPHVGPMNLVIRDVPSFQLVSLTAPARCSELRWGSSPCWWWSPHRNGCRPSGGTPAKGRPPAGPPDHRRCRVGGPPWREPSNKPRTGRAASCR